MSKLQWVVVAVVFVAAISAGGLFARSELSSVKLTTVSPGSLSIPYGTSSVISDPATTFKQAVILYSEGTVTSSQLSTTSTATIV